jgi:hypothetical protein
LRAAVSLAGGDTTRDFTGEDILVQAWKEDKLAWGLRGYEQSYPDSNKLYTKLDGKDGLVDRGLLRNVGPRTYQITETGLLEGTRLVQTDEESQVKIERQLQDSVLKILGHPAFKSWLKDPKTPAHFGDVGAFWGVAPGTPAKVVGARVGKVEQVLRSALKSLEKRNVEEFVKERGSRVRIEREDIERCLAFHQDMKTRFKSDLLILDPLGSY